MAEKDPETKRLEADLRPSSTPTPAKKLRFLVTVPPSGPPATPSDSAVPAGQALPRPLTEPLPGTKPGHHTYFVYADTREEAEHKVREKTRLERGTAITIEEAGHVDAHGRVHFPPDEEAAIRASMQDGRKAPGG